MNNEMLGVFERFLHHQVANGRPSLDTIRRYRTHVHGWIKWCRLRKIQLQAATKAHVTEYRKALIDTGYKPSSIALKLSVVRQFYRALKNAGVRTDNPADQIRPPRKRRAEEPEHFAESELNRLLRSIPEGSGWIALRDRAMLALMGLHGLRCVEIQRANVEGLKLHGKPALLARGKGRERLVRLRPDVAQLLAEYLERRPAAQADPHGIPLFTARAPGEGKRLSRRGIRHVVDAYLRKAGLKRPGASGHALRPTVATLAYRYSRDLRAVQEMLGHASPKTTARYAHLVERDSSPALSVPVEL